MSLAQVWHSNCHFHALRSRYFLQLFFPIVKKCSPQAPRAAKRCRTLHQVELWIAKIQRDVIARDVFTSVADLARKLRKYIRAYARFAKPFRWTYTDPRRRIRTYEITGTAH